MSFDLSADLESQSGRDVAAAPYRDDPSVELIASSSSFTTLVSSLSSKLFSIRQNLNILSRQLAQLGTPQDNAQLRAQHSSLLDRTRELVKSCGSDAKQLQLIEPTHSNQRYEQKKITQEFANVVREVQSVQRASVQKQKEMVHDMHTQAANAATHEAADGLPQQQQQQQQQQHEHVTLLEGVDDAQINFNETLIAEREDEIIEIEQGITELNEIFRDLGSIVAEQGTMIDNIESNVSQMHSNVRGASQELTSASKYQRGARKRACMLILIFTIIMGIVLAAVRFYLLVLVQITDM